MRALTDERVAWMMGAEDRYVVAAVDGDESDAARYHIVMNAREDEPPVTLEVTRAGDRTELLLRQDGFSEQTKRNRAERNWTSRIRRLARHLEAR